MNNQILKDTIKEWHSKTPDSVHTVGWGYKIKNEVCTDELCVVFSVLNKKPLAELTQEEILPTSLTIDNETIKTDVIQIGPASLCVDYAQCSREESEIDKDPPVRAHRFENTPLRGGISISRVEYLAKTFGTLGGLFRDKEDGSVVGLTCAHVVVPGTNVEKSDNVSWSNSARTALWDIENKQIAQPGLGDFWPVDILEEQFVGHIKRYYPLAPAGLFFDDSGALIPNNNRIDAAVISIDDATLLDNYSGSQLGSKPLVNHPVATTEEIDGLLTNHNVLVKSGRTTGYMDSRTCTTPICPEKIPLFPTSPIGSILVTAMNVSTTTTFGDTHDCIEFKFNARTKDALDDLEHLQNVLMPGDSGSLLLADFNGVLKIVGLCFAVEGSTEFPRNSGKAARIDTVMNLLNLEAIGPNDQRKINPASNWVFRLEDLPSTSSRVATKIIDNLKYWECGQRGNKTVYVTYGTKLTPPRNVAAAVGTSSINVSWDAPLVVGPVPIVGYRVQYSSSNGVAGSWVDFESPMSTLTVARITGLTNGKRYVIRVRAINADSSNSAFSANSTPVLYSPLPL